MTDTARQHRKHYLTDATRPKDARDEGNLCKILLPAGRVAYRKHSSMAQVKPVQLMGQGIESQPNNNGGPPDSQMSNTTHVPT